MTERSIPQDPSVDVKAQTEIEIHNFQVLTENLHNALRLFGGEAMLPSNSKEDIDYVVVNRQDSMDLPQLRFHANGWWSVRKPNAEVTEVEDILIPQPNNPDDVLRLYAHRIDPNFEITIAGRMQDYLENVTDDEIYSGQGPVFEETMQKFKDEENAYLNEKRALYLSRINAGLHAGLGRVLGVDRIRESALQE